MKIMQENTLILYTQEYCRNKPKILLFGIMDDHFKAILKSNLNASHTSSTPDLISGDISLVVTNTNAAFINTINRISNKTALLCYDENNKISVIDRINHPEKIICYLNTITRKIIKENVISLLKLINAYRGIVDGIPLIYSKESNFDELQRIMDSLNEGFPIHVSNDDPFYLYLLFKLSCKQTHYEKVHFVNTPNEYGKYNVIENTTLFLAYKNEAEFEQYSRENLREFSIVFITENQQAKPKLKSHVVCNLLNRPQDYYLCAYYCSIKQNLKKESETRFIKNEYVDVLLSQSLPYSGFLKMLENYFHDLCIANSDMDFLRWTQ